MPSGTGGRPSVSSLTTSTGAHWLTIDSTSRRPSRGLRPVTIAPSFPAAAQATA
jgi:hypothetical protein